MKGGIYHTFRHLSFQIKILLLLSFFVFCNVQVLFHVIFSLISYLCFSFTLLSLVNLFNICVLMLFIYVPFPMLLPYTRDGALLIWEKMLETMQLPWALTPLYWPRLKAQFMAMDLKAHLTFSLFHLDQTTI